MDKLKKSKAFRLKCKQIYCPYYLCFSFDCFQETGDREPPGPKAELLREEERELVCDGFAEPPSPILSSNFKPNTGISKQLALILPQDSEVGTCYCLRILYTVHYIRRY